MGGADDEVEGFDVAAGEGEGVVGRDGGDGIALANAIGEGGGEAFDVFLGTSGDGAPGVLGVESEEAVVVPKAHQGDGGELLDVFGRTGPDGGGHGGEIPVEEIGTVAAEGNVFGEGEVGVLWVFEFLDRLFVEAVDLEEHLPKSWAKEVAALAEEKVEAAAVEFEIFARVLDTEGHRSGLGGDVEIGEKTGEEGVSDLIVNHEAGVDGVVSRHHGVGVSADALVFFEEGEFVVVLKKVGAGEAGDSGADDSHFLTRGMAHGCLRPSSMICWGTGRRSQMMPNQERIFRPK